MTQRKGKYLIHGANANQVDNSCYYYLYLVSAAQSVLITAFRPLFSINFYYLLNLLFSIFVSLKNIFAMAALHCKTCAVEEGIKKRKLICTNTKRNLQQPPKKSV